MEWSIGGSTDLNWKKLATIVISDANYAGFGAEVEITDFRGNLTANKLLFDLKTQTLNISSQDKKDINLNIKTK